MRYIRLCSYLVYKKIKQQNERHCMSMFENKYMKFLACLVSFGNHSRVYNLLSKSYFFVNNIYD